MWGTWGECNRPCEGGTQTRTRKIAKEAWYGGVKCTDKDAKEKRPCNKHICPG